MNKYLRITEYLWMILAILSAITTAWYFIKSDNESGVFLMAITLFCGVMYNMRRMFNRRLQREARKREEEQSLK